MAALKDHVIIVNPTEYAVTVGALTVLSRKTVLAVLDDTAEVKNEGKEVVVVGTTDLAKLICAGCTIASAKEANQSGTYPPPLTAEQIEENEEAEGKSEPIPHRHPALYTITELIERGAHQLLAEAKPLISAGVDEHALEGV